MEMKKRLMMTFKTEGDKKISISVDNPRADVTEEEIKTVMDLILAKNIFNISGNDIVALVDAKVVQTGTTEFDLVL